jgi:hypothetical protein
MRIRLTACRRRRIARRLVKLLEIDRFVTGGKKSRLADSISSRDGGIEVWRGGFLLCPDSAYSRAYAIQTDDPGAR